MTKYETAERIAEVGGRGARTGQRGEEGAGEGGEGKTAGKEGGRGERAKQAGVGNERKQRVGRNFSVVGRRIRWRVPELTPNTPAADYP